MERSIYGRHVVGNWLSVADNCFLIPAMKDSMEVAMTLLGKACGLGSVGNQFLPHLVHNPVSVSAVWTEGNDCHFSRCNVISET